MTHRSRCHSTTKRQLLRGEWYLIDLGIVLPKKLSVLPNATKREWFTWHSLHLFKVLPSQNVNTYELIEQSEKQTLNGVQKNKQKNESASLFIPDSYNNTAMGQHTAANVIHWLALIGVTIHKGKMCVQSKWQQRVQCHIQENERKINTVKKLVLEKKKKRYDWTDTW